MSAYGTITAPTRSSGYPLPLPARAYPLKESQGDYNALVFLHFHSASTHFGGSTLTDPKSQAAADKRKLPATWKDALYSTFQQILKDGKTYPQYGPLKESEFDQYFLGNDLVVGVFASDPSITASHADGIDYEEAKLGLLD